MNNAIQSLMRPVSMTEWAVIKEQAAILMKSGLLPNGIKTVEQAIAIMLKGRELNIPHMAALTTIHVISGNPTVSPQLMLALIERSGQLQDVAIEGDEKACTVTMQRNGRLAHTETFTVADADKMGLSGKENWRKMPAIMLKWRAVAACARVVFPDVILGLYTPEELGAAVDDEGNYVDGAVDAPALASGHWADNGGRERFLRRMKALELDLELVKSHLEPGRILNHLNETSLTKDQAMIRLEEMAEGHSKTGKEA